MIRFRIASLLLLVLAGCGASDAPADSSSRKRVVHEPDAGTTSARVVSGVGFEAQDGALTARAPDHAVLALGEELRIESARGPLLSLGASRASRGGASLGVAAAPSIAQGGGLRRAMSAAIDESVVVRPLGTEQSWRLPLRPAGSGELRVTVPVVHGRYLGSDARGLRFVDDGGEVLYSHATFVDAAGARTSVPAVFIDGTIVLRVPAATLDAARYPAVLDPTISPITTITGPTTAPTFPAYGDQKGASLGRISPTSALVAYVDLADPTLTTIDALFVDQTGAAVGTVFRVASGTSAHAPEVSCNASDCLVVYEVVGGLRGVRVSAAGAILDATPIEIAYVGSLVGLDVHDDGTSRIVAWSDRGPSTSTVYTVSVRRVAYDGTLVGSAAIDVGTAAGSAAVDVSAWSGTTVVAWDDVLGTDGRIRGARLDASDVLLDASPVTLIDSPSAIESAPRFLDRGTDLVLFYYASSAIRAAIVSTTPALALGTSKSVYSVSAGNVALPYSVASDGTTSELALVVPTSFPTGYAIYRAGITAALATSGNEQWMGRGTAVASVDVAPTSGGRVLVASLRREATFTEVDTNGYEVQSASTSTSDRNLTLGASSARAPGAVWSTQFAVSSIVDQASVGQQVAATRFAPDTSPLDVTPATLATAVVDSSTHDEMNFTAPSFLGTDFLGAWRRGRYDTFASTQTQTVEIASFARTGPINVGILRQPGLGAQFGIIGGASATGISIIGGGTAYRHVITASTVSTGSYLSSLASISPQGARVDGTLGIAWSATGFGVVGPSNTPVALTWNTSDDGTFGLSQGTRSTLIVRRDAPATSSTRIWATLLNLSGSATIKGAFAATSGTGPFGSPRAVFDGTNYDVFFVRGSTLYLVRVDEDGTVLDLVPSVVATGVYDVTRAIAVAGDRAGKVLVAFETYDPSAGVRALRVSVRVIDWNGTGTGASNGTACTSVLDCASGNCVDGTCCATACGFGATNDCQACSAAAHGTMPDGTCGPTDTSVVCRASAGLCDAADTCDGSSTVCPADLKVPAGTICGALSTQPCETDQVCNGVGNACPAKAPEQGNPICRPATGDCDVAERCTGTSTACPVDGVANGSVVCRPAADVCDAPETCNGLSKTCGVDGFLGNTTTCRPSAGGCDRADACDGTGIACPADAPATQGTSCRPAFGACDASEVCDGVSFTCPLDEPAPAGTSCRDAIGVCDVAEFCDGTGFACPVDEFAGPEITCRGAAGFCDAAETCTGLGPSCPAIDARKPAGTLCRIAIAGGCDAAETCDGVGVTCPADVFQPLGTICRPADGICDSAESCSGLGPLCPRDRDRIDGSSCSDGLFCNGDEVCAAGECVVGEALVCEGENVCIEGTGQCSVPTRPGGAAGCSLAEPTRQVDPPWMALGALLAIVVVRRRVVLGPRLFALGLALGLGGCVCGVGAVPCDGACVDVGYDERNCGACGVSCGAGQCIEGACVGVPATGGPCEDDEQCKDGNVCNGIERCVGGRCRDGEEVACDDGLACTTDVCSPEAGSCVATPQTGSCGQTP